jgi:hypothetical protein
MNASINPAWNTLLSKIPEEFHNQIVPDLKQWDQQVQSKFQEIHASYEPLKAFKSFADNGIDSDYAWKAVQLADQLQNDPGRVVNDINEAWKLGYTAPGVTPPASSSEDDDLFGESDDDITSHPKFKAMQDALTQVQAKFKEDAEREQEDAEIADFEAELDSLESATKEKNLPFHRLFVTSLMAQGLSGEDAVKQYHEALAITSTSVDNAAPESAVETPSAETPVMGSAGSTGSGLPDGSVDYAKLNRNDFNSTVEQLLAQAQESGQ